MGTQSLVSVLRYFRQLASPIEPEDHSDGTLLQEFVGRRDEAAFTELLERHGPLVIRICRQILGNSPDAEDAFQATFLVLARKAASIRKQESLAAWLHRVAVNLSRRVRAAAVQRRAHEKRAVLMAQPGGPLGEVVLRDWQALLHEELDRLHEKYRLPIVLCYLEGKTHDEAARKLGWPLGTVKGRLARARALLRSRLTRRGLTLSGATLATALTPSGATGHVPATLLAHTLRSAVAFAAKKAIPAGAVSAQALALANGGLQTITGLKLLSLLALFLVAGALTYSLAGGTSGNEPRADALRPPAEVADAKPERTDAHGDPLPPGAVARLGTLRFRHGKGITAVALSPDGKTITSAGSDGSIVVHNATTGAKLGFLPAQSSSTAVAMAPDGRTMAAVVGGRRIFIREAVTGKRLCEFQVEKGPIHALAFSADGGMLAGGESHLVHVWDVRAGKEVGRITPPGHETLTIALSGDGKTLATAGWDRKERPILCLWETARSRKIRQWQPVTEMEETHALSFSPDGKCLASASGYADSAPTERLRVWDVAGGERLLDLPGRFHSLRYSPSGKVLAAEGSGAISLRAADTGKEIRRIAGSGPMSFSADDKTLALADHYSTITFWDLTTGKKLSPPLAGHSNWVRKVHFLAGGKVLASLGDDATYFWQVATAKNISRFEGPITQRALSPDGKMLAAMAWRQQPVGGQMIELWDSATGKKLREVQATSTNAGVMDFAFCPDGKALAPNGFSASSD
jgi:RNA polymerase sigma factor (sigma-70 family)